MARIKIILLMLVSFEISSSMPPIMLPEIVITAKPYEQIIYEGLTEKGVSHELALIIVAQAKHESGNFKSNVFLENNNPFGMKCAKKRQTTCTGTNRYHATYDTIEDSITDYIYYMENMGIPFHETSAKKYVFLLKSKNYFEADVVKYYIAVKKFHV